MSRGPYWNTLEETLKVLSNNKVIYLDIDGVIATPSTRFKLDYNRIVILRELVQAIDARIIISSSWRTNGVESLATAIWMAGGISIEYFIACIDTHPSSDRVQELSDYIVSHPLGKQSFINGFVVIDDVKPDRKKWISKFWVNTHTIDGLTHRDVEEAYRIFNIS